MQDITRILILENLYSDYELAQREILKVIPGCQFERENEQFGFLNALRNFHPDLIVSEYELQTFDVVKVLSLLQKHSARIPVIVLTALAMPNDRQRCLEAGMDEYISKPVNLRALKKLIESILCEKAGIQPKGGSDGSKS